ncbi:phage tail sheath C-terminal domain-containing protein [Caballeronia humi]|uniref:Phage tail sheath protein n=1 Tax=Caballeronia humi TaxID=326474 RepID=A0A158G774_9BURK|nr:phage tail sheath C-terminal domain-containing protein [Caballeronia humi]SAL27945.1 phage tail sheath protein [Caballeronia humi]
MSSATYLAPGVYVEEVPSAQQPIAGVGTNVVGLIGIVPPTIYLPVPNPDYDPVAARAALELEALTARRAELDPGKPEHAGEIATLDAERERRIASLRGTEQELKTKLGLAQTKLVSAKADLDKATTERDDAQKALQPLDAEFEAASAEDKAAKQAALDTARTTLANKETALRRVTSKHAAADTDIARLQRELAETSALLPAEPGTAETPKPGEPVPPAPQNGEKEDGGEKKGAGGDNDPLAKELAYFDSESKPDDRALSPSILRPYILQAFTLKADACDTKLCTNFTEYTDRFGTFSAYRDDPVRPAADPANPDAPDNPDKWIFQPCHPGHHALTHAVNGFFKNGGTKAFVARIERLDQLERVLKNFRSIDEIAIIAAPGLPRTPDTWEALMTHAENRENCYAILDTPEEVADAQGDLDIGQLQYSGTNSILPRVCKNAALYFPHIEVSDPAKELQDADPGRRVAAKYRGRTYVPPSGHMAGIYALTDTQRGVHKAPANVAVRGALEVKYYISKPLQELLNPQGVNAIRIMSNTVTVWGARGMGGDKLAEWKYISVRRLFLFLQKSIEEGTQWIVFEPNDEALWGKIKLNITAFLTNVWRTGALFGTTPEQAFYVKCDAELNPPAVRDVGQVVTEIGVAIVRPAEFVIFRITQSTGMTNA